MPKITAHKGKDVVHVGKNLDPVMRNARWWLIKNPSELSSSVLGVVSFLKDNQTWRHNQAGLYARLYGNMPIWNYLGVNLTNLSTTFKYPSDRPTMNVIQSCVDGLVARLTQSRPRPQFLTSGGDFKRRKQSKELNQFIDGEFYESDVYNIGENILRDAAIMGDGIVKVFEDDNNRVALERTMPTELYVDEMDAMYGTPRQLHQLKLYDRDILIEMFPTKKQAILNANPSYFDSTSERVTIANQVIACESWHLPSSLKATDGRHVIVIDNGILLDEDYSESCFPFVKIPYSPRTLGYWAQGLAEQLMGIQSEINKLLITIQQSLHLVGVPKWMVEDGSKIVNAHINNAIGGIVKYQGTMPTVVTPQCVPMELYGQLERLIGYAYQQSGVSQLAASSQKPAGLDSGAALREFDDLQSDRFNVLSKRYERFFIELSYQMFRKAKRIAEREGKYRSIYPGKNTLISVDFPGINLTDDDYIIQAFPVSSLPKDPAGRLQMIQEQMQAGLISPDEGRRLLDFPDLQQQQDLANAPEERILKLLDGIVEDEAKDDEEPFYEPPEPDMNLGKAKELTLQYINKFAMTDIGEEKLQRLRVFNSQIDALLQPPQDMMQPQGAMPQPGQGAMPQAGVVPPQAAPEPTPTTNLIPNIQGAA